MTRRNYMAPSLPRRGRQSTLSDISSRIRLSNCSSNSTRGFSCHFQERSSKGFFLIFRKQLDICLLSELRGRLLSDAIVSVQNGGLTLFVTHLKIIISFSYLCLFLAHLSGRLMGELIGYPGVRPSSSVVHKAQRSSPKLLGQSKPNFTWSLFRKREQNFVRGIWVT